MAKKKILVSEPMTLREVLELYGLGALQDVYEDLKEALGNITVLYAELEAEEPEQQSLF